MSQDRAIALQPGQQERNSTSKEKKERKANPMEKPVARLIKDVCYLLSESGKKRGPSQLTLQALEKSILSDSMSVSLKTEMKGPHA